MKTERDSNQQERRSLARSLVLCLLVIGLALGVSACGRKSDPSHPEGATYPEEYPTE